MKLPKIGFKFKMNIGGRLALGFAAVSVVLAAAVQVFKENGIENERLTAEQETNKQKAEEEKKHALMEMADSLEKNVGGGVDALSTSTTPASAVEEQRAATGEISRNVQEAASGTREVSSNIAGVSEAARDTGSAAEEMKNAAGGLSEQSALLRKEVESFLKDIRTA
jgi:methyl-accepting chemotaxis protein